MAYSRGHICHCLGRIESLRRDSPVSIAGNRRKTGREFVEAVRALAGGLATSGIARGDVIAVAALNSDCYMELFLAVTYIGGIVAPLNYRWSFEEARLAMEMVRPKMLAVDGSCIAWALKLQNSGSLSCLELYLLIGECSPDVRSRKSFMTMDSTRKLTQGATLSYPIFALRGVALICFTSGTTGKPKGVSISHTALIVQSLAKIAIVGYGEDDVYLHTAPLCHIGGISSCISMLLAGACHILIPKFDAKSTFQAIRDHQVTSFICVPTMMADLIAYDRKYHIWNDGKSINKILNGGGSLSKELVRSASCLFPHAKIFSAYGMTEACSSLTFMNLFDPTLKKSEEVRFHAKLGHLNHQLGGVCVGRPAPHVELRISGSNGSHDSQSIGSILTRGLHVMIGYWGQSNTSTIDIADDEWLDTGDIGWLDGKGDLWLVGRKKGRIKSGGENVYPEEVEAVLSQHPGISNVVVVGIPDIHLTEKVVACITVKDDWEWITENSGYSKERKIVSPAVLQKHCRRENLSRFKIPKTYILWRKAFPVTSTGKLRRDDVRKEILSDIQLPSNL